MPKKLRKLNVRRALPLALSLLTVAPIILAHPSAQERLNAFARKSTERTKYKVDLALDFDNRSYTGSELVRWTNRGDHPTSVIFFHLYPNLRSEQSSTVPPTESDEPRIDLTDVQSELTAASVHFSLDDQGTTLRLNLRESIAPGSSTEVRINFKGEVPEIDAEETGLVTHVVKQVSAALRSEREIRRARDMNFRCRGVMLLGAAYPVVAVHDGDEWRRRIEPGVGDAIFSEASDYEVTVAAPSGVAVFTSGTERATGSKEGRMFVGTSLRHFTIIAGRSLHAEQREVGDVTVRSVFLPEHERVGLRVLATASEAVRAFVARFGPLPFKTVSVVEAPLVAGFGSAEFAGLVAIASAFYVDFDSPAMRNLPEIIREQRSAVEDSLEWTVCRLVARQWWGAAVGNDPARDPVLDEALSCWSALTYYREVYGEQKVKAALEDQLRGVYRLYRTFGGEDMDADRPSRDYRNSFQYVAIVATKGALMLVELQRVLGDQRFFAAMRNYYRANLLEIADLDDLRGALVAEAPIEQRRGVARTFSRWLSSRRGDEDISPPDRELAVSLGLPAKPGGQKGGSNAFTPFAKLGKFFWQQMTRIH